MSEGRQTVAATIGSQREEEKKVYAEAKAKLEKEESEEKANGSTNGLGNRRIVVVGQLSGKPKAIIRDRK